MKVSRAGKSAIALVLHSRLVLSITYFDRFKQRQRQWFPKQPISRLNLNRWENGNPCGPLEDDRNSCYAILGPHTNVISFIVPSIDKQECCVIIVTHTWNFAVIVLYKKYPDVSWSVILTKKLEHHDCIEQISGGLFFSTLLKIMQILFQGWNFLEISHWECKKTVIM